MILLLLIANLILKTLDIWTTYKIVTTYGIRHEGNPLMRKPMEWIGVNPTLALSFVITAAFIIYAFVHSNSLMLGIFALILWWVVANNLKVMKRKGLKLIDKGYERPPF